MGAVVSVEAARYQRVNGVGKNWTKEELERREEEAAKLNSKNKKIMFACNRNVI